MTLIESALVWFINIFLKLLKLKRRDKNIWLFGAWDGEDYRDNSKYLFEYVIRNLPEIDAVWITKDNKVKERLIKEGKKCYLSREREGQKLRLKAGYIFFTNGISDLGKFDLCHGAIKVALWHGMPLKRLCFATNNLKKRNKSIFRYIQYLILKLYSKTQRDITIATSVKAKEFLVECFELKPRSVLITGQPRNDVLFDSKIVNRLRRKLNHREGEHFVLYMPTWRDFGQHERFLDEIIYSLLNDTRFIESLKERRIKLYIKPHPRVSINSRSSENIIILEQAHDIDPQELIASADVLITDYSSVFIDYALTEKPILFFVPDIEQYEVGRNGLFLDFQDFSEFWFKDLESFKASVLNNPEYRDLGILNAKKINSIYDDSSLIRGKYCKSLVKSLAENKIIDVCT